MATMSDRNSRRASGGSKRLLSWLMIGGGAVMAGVGFVVGLPLEGDVATGWGVLAGVGFALAFCGAVMLWLNRMIDLEASDPGGATKRERLLAERSRMLWLFPIAAAAFQFQATRGTIAIMEGGQELSDYLSIFLPVLYAWVVTMIVMGWDGHTRKHRRFLEDELTQLIRARAMTAAAIVLMAGLTIAFGLGLWRAEIGVLAASFALTAGGAAAGIRFAWLDREAGKDG